MGCSVFPRPQPHTHMDTEMSWSKEPPWLRNSYLNQGQRTVWSSSCPFHLNKLHGRSGTTLRVSVSSSGKEGQSLPCPREHSGAWQKISGLLPLFPSQQQGFHLFMFQASMLGFIWCKGSASGTFLAFFLRQGLTHLHLLPTGSVNDPRLASQTAGQPGGQRSPQDGKERALDALKIASPEYSLRTKEMQLTCLLSSGAFRKSALITAMV